MSKIRKIHTTIFNDYSHEIYHITDGLNIMDDGYLPDKLIELYLGNKLSSCQLAYLCLIIGKCMYSKGILDALEYKKSKKKENKKMKKTIKRTLDVIKLTSPSGEIKYLPGNTPLKTIMHDYPLWTMESCIIKASMPEDEFIQKALVKEIDNEEE